MTENQLENIKTKINDQNAVEVAKALEETIRKRLDDKIIDLIDLPLGKTDKDLELYMSLAEEHGLEDEKDILLRLSYEKLREVIRAKTSPRKTRKQKEKELEDFLSMDDNLRLLEPGLSFLSRQEVIESGRLDILAKDREDRKAVVELKMGKYVSKDVFWQLTKYMNERPNDRAFFVAPVIKPDLYYALRGHIEAGRLVMYEAKELEESYKFKKIGEENLPKNGRKNLDTSKRKRSNKDLITIVAGTTEQVKRRSKGKMISEDWSCYPFYYQMILLHNLSPNDNANYLLPFKTDVRTKQQLTGLLKTPELDRWAELYDEEFDCDPDLNPPIDPRTVPKVRYRKQAELGQKGERIFHSLLIECNQLTELALRYISGYGAPPTLENLGSLRKELNGLLLDFDNPSSSDMKTLKKYLTDLVGSCINKLPDKRYAEGLRSMNRLPKEHIINELIRVKIQRAQALEFIDPVLAQAYLRYSITSDNAIGLMRNEVPDYTFHLGHQRIKKYLERDKELYQSILNNLEVIEPSQALGTKQNKNQNQHQTTPSEEVAYLPIIEIRKAILNGNPDRFIGYERWVDYLVEDIASAKYSKEEHQAFAAALTKANLSKPFRNRDARPQMHGLETFSQDITLDYILKGKVPSAEELKELYRRDLSQEDN